MKTNPCSAIPGICSALLIALLFIVGLSACKKSEDAKPVENTITSFLTSETTVQSGTRTGTYELGIVFNASAAGKITQVGSKMPDPGSYRVIIWDFDSKAVLRQKTIEQSSPNALTLDAIDPLTLTTNKKYVISINSQSGGVVKKYGYAAKTGGGDFMPFAKGNILVLNACFSGVATPTFPSSVANVKYEFYGFPEFTFIPD